MLLCSSRRFPLPRIRPRLAARFSSFTVLGCAFVASVSLLVLAGWTFNIECLKTLLYRGPVGMNPLTAVAFLLCTGSLWLKRVERPRGTGSPRLAADACAMAVIVIAALGLIWQFKGWDSHIDEWLFRTQLATRLGRNRMAPNTSFNFLLTGFARFSWIMRLPVAAGRRSS